MKIWECEPGRLPHVIRQSKAGDFVAINGKAGLVIKTDIENNNSTIYIAPDPEEQPNPKSVVKISVDNNDEFAVTQIGV